MPSLRSRVMVGRDAELSLLLELAVNAREGRGSVVVVSGEAGVGKSRLISELTDRIHDSDLVIVGHGVELPDGDLPFGVLAESVRDLIRQVGVERVRTYLGHAAEHLSGIVPALGEGSTLDRVLVLGATLTLLDQLSADRPVCWVVEDLLWADRLSRELFTIAARSVAARRQILIASVRPSAANPSWEASFLADLQSQPHAHTVDLGRLNEADVRRQIAGIGRPDLTSDLTERIVRLGEGVPLHVEQLVANLDRVESRLPVSLSQIVLARLPRLSDRSRLLVEAASVAEGQLDLVRLKLAMGLSDVDFDGGIDEAVKGGVLEVTDQTASIAFVHALVREAVATSVLPSRRREHHRAWARAIETRGNLDPASIFALARHWVQAGDAAAALGATCRAAALSAEIGDALLETSHWAGALELWHDVPDAEAVAGISRNEILYNLSVATMAAGSWKEFHEIVIQELARTSRHTDPLGHLWLSLCADAARDRLAGVFTVDEPTTRERAMTLLGAAADIRAADALQRNARVARRFDPRLADVQHRAALAMAEGLGHRKARLRAALFVGFDAQVRAHPRAEADRMAALGAEFHDAPIADRLLIAGIQMEMLVGGGYDGEAINLAGRVLPPIRDPSLVPIRYGAIALHLARAHLNLGDWPAAERLVDLLRTLPGTEADAESTAMRLMVLRGDTLDMPDVLRRVESVLEEGRNTLDDQPVMGDVVLTLYALGQADEARGMLTHLAGYPSGWRASSIWPAVNASLRAETAARSARSLDSVPRAFVDDLDVISTRLEWECPAADAYRAEHAALMASYRGTDTPAMWLAAASAWARIGRIWDEAVCRGRLAASLVAVGQRDEAHVEILKVLEVADRLGAAPLRAEVLALARRARLPLPTDAKDQPPGLAFLTTREREVLSLVAAGRSNNEIAGELYMSPKTASVHVSRILAKLHARNRTEAANIARRHLLLD